MLIERWQPVGRSPPLSSIGSAWLRGNGRLLVALVTAGAFKGPASGPAKVSQGGRGRHERRRGRFGIQAAVSIPREVIAG